MVYRSRIKDEAETFLNGDDYRSVFLRKFISHVSRFINEKEGIAPDIAIIGGMLRDIAYLGVESFNSDIDLIIDCKPATLVDYAGQNGIARNKFGGYQFSSYDDTGNAVEIDFWCLWETWTHVNAGVPVSSIYDSINGVFFSCDQIAYVINRKRLIMSDDYVDNMESRKLSIVIESNPLPRKIAKKAVKHISKYRFVPDTDMQRFIDAYS